MAVGKQVGRHGTEEIAECVHKFKTEGEKEK